jgi:FKBP-type peptidyl-prolyl cis-trans isomerase FkpA
LALDAGAMNTTIKALAAAALLGFPAIASAQVASPIIPLPLNPVVDAGHRTCTAKTASGLGYTELRAAPAGAAKPGDADVVLINYLGYLAANGAVFDQAQRTPMPVSGVISGFGEGIKLAAKGAVMRLCIPAAIGYGAQASGPIPANSDLVFQVELIDFKSMAEIEAMQKQAEAQAEPKPAPK